MRFASFLVSCVLIPAVFGQSAEDYRRQALEYMRLKQWNQAAECYRKAIAIQPQDALSHYNLGGILLSQARVKEALAELQTAGRLQPGDPAIGCTLARAYLQDAQPEPAISGFRKCLRARTQDFESHYYLGIALGQTGDISGAAAEFRQVIAIKPDFGPAHQSLGVSLRRHGDDPQALIELKAAAKLMPDNPIAWCDLGLALKASGETQAAIDAFRHALALKPDYERASYGLGLALKKEGQNEAAAAQMNAVARGHAQRARIAEAQKLVQDGADDEKREAVAEAEQAYSKALELEPGYTPAEMALGILYARTGDSSKAAAQLHDATLSNPDSADAHYDYALVLAESGQPDPALHELEECLAIQPDHLEAQMQARLDSDAKGR